VETVYIQNALQYGKGKQVLLLLTNVYIVKWKVTYLELIEVVGKNLRLVVVVIRPNLLNNKQSTKPAKMGLLLGLV